MQASFLSSPCGVASHALDGLKHGIKRSNPYGVASQTLTELSLVLSQTFLFLFFLLKTYTAKHYLIRFRFISFHSARENTFNLNRRSRSPGYFPWRENFFIDGMGKKALKSVSL
jgi:hypothetical protein